MTGADIPRYRRFYRVYLERHRFFRVLKSSVLQTFWNVRMAAYKSYWKARAYVSKVCWKIRQGRFVSQLVFLICKFFRDQSETVPALKWLMLNYYHLRLNWSQVDKNNTIIAFRLPAISFLRHIYRRYFSRFLVFRIVKAKLVVLAALLFGKVLLVMSRFGGRDYRLLSMGAYQGEQGIAATEISPETVLEIPGPQFVGKYPFDLAVEDPVFLVSPKIELSELHNVTVMGGSNFIIDGDQLVHPEQFDPYRDVPPAETFHIASVYPEKASATLYNGEPKRKVNKVVTLLGQCTGNYAHWLTETLPRLLVLDGMPGYEELPLLVDGWIHPVFYETLRVFNKNKRKIIKVERWELVVVSHLVDISPTAYVPPEYREFINTGEWPKTGFEDFPYSRFGLDLLRKAAQETVSTMGVSKTVANKGKKLYLRRSAKECGNMRGIVNMQDAEMLIEKFGFDFIEPGALSFCEQIQLFQEAGLVIAPVGAALVNTIFTNPGCKIIALAAYYKNANYYYFSNLMGTLGHELYYVLGPQVENYGHPAHRDYRIDLNALQEALEKVC